MTTIQPADPISIPVFDWPPVSEKAGEVWEICSAELEMILTASDFEKYVLPIQLVALDRRARTATIQVTTPTQREWLAAGHDAHIRRQLASVLHLQEIEIAYIVAESNPLPEIEPPPRRGAPPRPPANGRRVPARP